MMIVTSARKTDLAKLAASEPPIVLSDTLINEIALGDGGLIDGVPRIVDPSETDLVNETLRRSVVFIARTVDSNEWEIVLAAGELANFQYNEVAVFSNNGNMVAAETFATKTKQLAQKHDIKFRENFGGIT